jgi:hypothetical protein
VTLVVSIHFVTNFLYFLYFDDHHHGGGLVLSRRLSSFVPSRRLREQSAVQGA